MKKNTIQLFTALTLSLNSLVALADVVVVVNPKNAASSLTSDQAQQIFLGKINTFPSGGSATPIDQKEGSSPRSEFYSKVAGKDEAQLKAYWSRIIFSGKGQPPKELASSADVKKFVAENPNGIGYIEKSAVDGTVKVILSP